MNEGLRRVVTNATTAAGANALNATATSAAGAASSGAAAGATRLAAGQGSVATTSVIAAGGLGVFASAAVAAQAAMGPISIARGVLVAGFAAVDVFKEFFSDDLPDGADESKRAIDEVTRSIENQKNAADLLLATFEKQNSLLITQRTLQDALTGEDLSASEVAQRTAEDIQAAEQQANANFRQALAEAKSLVAETGELDNLAIDERRLQGLQGNRDRQAAANEANPSAGGERNLERIDKEIAVLSETIEATRQLFGVDLLEELGRDGLTKENATDIINELNALRPGMREFGNIIEAAVVSGVEEIVTVESSAADAIRAGIASDASNAKSLEAELKTLQEQRAEDVDQATRTGDLQFDKTFLDTLLTELDGAGSDTGFRGDIAKDIQQLLAPVLNRDELSEISSRGNLLQSGTVRDVLGEASDLDSEADQQLVDRISETQAELERLRNSRQEFIDFQVGIKATLAEHNDLLRDIQTAAQ